MVAFIDDQMTVVGDDVLNLAVADEALNESHIDDARRLSFTAANNADLFWVYLQKGS